MSEGKKKTPAGWIIFVAVLIGLATIGNMIKPDDEMNTQGASSSGDTERLADYGARQIVKESLLSPATAKFASVQVMQRSGSNFFIRLAVDSHNNNGAMVRKEMMVVLKIKDGSLYYNQITAVAEYDASLASQILFKRANGWPEG